MNSAEIIQRVWFEGERVFILTSTGRQLSRPLEAFPRLKDATDVQRSRFEIGMEGDDIHWEDLDEDIHISSFLENSEPDPDNEIGLIFKRFPQLNVSQMAHYMGIDKTLLARYIYGIKKPSPERRDRIIEAIRALGKEMSSI